MTADEVREYMEEWWDFGYLFIRARWTMDSSHAPGSSSTSLRITASPSLFGGEESPMRLVEEDE